MIKKYKKKKSLKIPKIHLKYFFSAEKHTTNAILLVLPNEEIVFDQSSPVHPVSESWGSSPNVTESERTNEEKKWSKNSLRILL